MFKELKELNHLTVWEGAIFGGLLAVAAFVGGTVSYRLQAIYDPPVARVFDALFGTYDNVKTHENVSGHLHWDAATKKYIVRFRTEVIPHAGFDINLEFEKSKPRENVGYMVGTVPFDAGKVQFRRFRDD